MTWVRIDDRAPTHPKLRDAGAEAAWLWLCGLAWCNGFHTDGLIRKADLGALYPEARGWTRKVAKDAAKRLVSVGLWHDEGESWRVHDYADYQEEATRDVQVERREYERARKARQRKAKRAGVPPYVPDIVAGHVPRDVAGDSPGCVPVGVPRPVPERLAGGPEHGSVERVPTPRPVRPDPTRPVCDGDRDTQVPDLSTEPGRWGAWLLWRIDAGKADDIGANRPHLETAWQAVERDIAAKMRVHPRKAFERLCRAYLAWADDRPLPGGKVAPLGNRPASWLPSGVYQLAKAQGTGANGAKLSPAEEVARRKQLAAIRDARAAS